MEQLSSLPPKKGAGHLWGSTAGRPRLSTRPVIVHLELSFRLNALGPQENGARGQVMRYPVARQTMAFLQFSGPGGG